MSQDQFTKVLDKFIESFDDFKERLIRIEENVKDVKNVKGDVEELKIKYVTLESKGNSAHKRIDGLEQEGINTIQFDGHDKRIAALEKIVSWVSATVIGVVILSVLSLVIIKK